MHYALKAIDKTEHWQRKEGLTWMAIGDVESWGRMKPVARKHQILNSMENDAKEAKQPCFQPPGYRLHIHIAHQYTIIKGIMTSEKNNSVD